MLATLSRTWTKATFMRSNSDEENQEEAEEEAEEEEEEEEEEWKGRFKTHAHCTDELSGELLAAIPARAVLSHFFVFVTCAQTGPGL
jgi:CRISPR/Cas system CMR subunit Cmr4 (Cas7 group RAMP superfamily)